MLAAVVQHQPHGKKSSVLCADACSSCAAACWMRGSLLLMHCCVFPATARVLSCRVSTLPNFTQWVSGLSGPLSSQELFICSSRGGEVVDGKSNDSPVKVFTPCPRTPLVTIWWMISSLYSTVLRNCVLCYHGTFSRSIPRGFLTVYLLTSR